MSGSCCASGLGQHGHARLGWQTKMTIQLCLSPTGGSRLLLHFRVVVQLLHRAAPYRLLGSTSNVIFIPMNFKTSCEECKISRANK